VKASVGAKYSFFWKAGRQGVRYGKFSPACSRSVEERGMGGDTPERRAGRNYTDGRSGSIKKADGITPIGLS
jgi:hypothetical protein